MSDTCPKMTDRHKRISISISVILIGCFILIVDQLIKRFVYHDLPVIDSSYYSYPYGGIGVFKNFGGIEFSINHMTNTGAAWGIFGNYQLPLIILRGILIVGLIIYLFCFNDSRSSQFPLILIIAGAIGNVLDYFIYGHVIDMFHFVLWGYDFPIFNLADTSISIGIAYLFILSLMNPSPTANKE